MVKHMDNELKGTEQIENLRAIESDVSRIHIVLTTMILNSFPHISQLMEQYPEIFATEESKKRLYFATRFVLHVHGTRRCKFKKKVQHPAAPTRSSPIIKHDQKKNQQSEAVRAQNLALESASQTLPRSNKSTKHDPNQYQDIRTFLENSMPPMTHLMDAFINFGCINGEFLLAISSWPLERIREVLDQLSLGPNDKPITEMDKYILENHFKEYFTQVGKRGNSMHKSDL